MIKYRVEMLKHDNYWPEMAIVKDNGSTVIGCITRVSQMEELAKFFQNTDPAGNGWGAFVALHDAHKKIADKRQQQQEKRLELIRLEREEKETARQQAEAERVLAREQAKQAERERAAQKVRERNQQAREARQARLEAEQVQLSTLEQRQADLANRKARIARMTKQAQELRDGN